jgi:hypothetical protein
VLDNKTRVTSWPGRTYDFLEHYFCYFLGQEALSSKYYSSDKHIFWGPFQLNSIVSSGKLLPVSFQRSLTLQQFQKFVVLAPGITLDPGDGDVAGIFWVLGLKKPCFNSIK